MRLYLWFRSHHNFASHNQITGDLTIYSQASEITQTDADSSSELGSTLYIDILAAMLEDMLAAPTPQFFTPEMS